MEQQAPRVSPERLHALFHPRSIALVGATDKSRWSVNTFQNLKTFGFPGPVYCVNPNYETVHGTPAVRRLADIAEPIDLAYIMVPTQRVYAIVEEAAAPGVPNLVILTAGFGEVGEEDLWLEREVLVAGGMEHGMMAIGNAIWWHETHRSATGEQPGQAAEATPLPIHGEISGEWTGTETRALLQAHDIPVVPGLLARNEQEAVEVSG